MNLSSAISRYLPTSEDPTAFETIPSSPGPSTTALAMALFAWYPYHPNAPSLHIDPSAPPRRTEIVQCRICERRVALWSFQTNRTFDLVEEHLVWCPTGQRGWWEGCAVLDPPGMGRIWEGEGGVKGVLRVSERLERKPWRRG
jgi:hypothetical protein